MRLDLTRDDCRRIAFALRFLGGNLDTETTDALMVATGYGKDPGFEIQLATLAKEIEEEVGPLD